MSLFYRKVDTENDIKKGQKKKVTFKWLGPNVRDVKTKNE